MKIYLSLGIGLLLALKSSWKNRHQLNASGATKQKLPAGKVPISKNFAFLACVSYLWPSIPSKIGMRSTALVGLSALRSSAIFFIILDIAFSCVPKLLKGGFIYTFFQTMIEKKHRIT